MEWILVIGTALTGIGILVGLYLPVLAGQYATPEKLRAYFVAGAALVVIGTIMQIVAIWPSSLLE